MLRFLIATTQLLALASAAAVAQDPPFQMAPGFEIEAVAKEPVIRQPVYLNFDERGRLWVVQYLQFPFPAGLKVTGHDEYWRIQYENFPPPAPPNHYPGQDKVTILEDTDGDGAFESTKDFVTGLSVTTGALVGRGGVWVLNPPYLLFYADANRDDVPDGEPVVHLAGFGLEDLHAVANGLCWGADGWLYGYQGSTTTATISRPGMGDEGLHFKGQNLWRYNTADRRFELFAEGGHNNFGIAQDAAGRMFTGGNGGVIGFHQVQGGYYWKGWAKHGELTNPYAYGWFENMEDHSSKVKLSQGMVSYQAPNFPPEYQNYLFTARALVHGVSAAEIVPQGSTYAAHERFQLLHTEDPHFQPVYMTQGPDGALYVADWHDSNITWSVSAENDRIQRETGRIYRVTYGKNTPFAPFDLGTASTEKLIEMLEDPNKWYRQTALRVLYDRKDASAIPALASLVESHTDQRALEALWALNASGGFSLDVAAKALDHPQPLLRSWAIRLLGNDHTINESLEAQLAALAANETDVQVRSQLASTCKRLAPAEALPIMLAMLRSGKDTGDPHVPLLLWWALEQHIRTDRVAVLAWVDGARQANSTIFDTTLAPRLGRRFVQDRRVEDFEACATLLGMLKAPDQRQAFLGGIAEGLGRGSVPSIPASLKDRLAALLEEDPGNTQLLIIAARLGNTGVFDRATAMVVDAALPVEQRLPLIKLLGEETHAPAKDALLALFRDPNGGALRAEALGALQQFSDPAIGAALLAALPNGGELKARIAGALVARKAWATGLLQAVDSGAVPAADVDRDLLASLATLNDPAIDALVQKHWGAIRTSPAEKLAQVNAIWATIKNGPGNARPGVAIYEQTCGKCHVHLGVGRKVGPDITGLNRVDLWALVTNIIDPGKSVLPEYTGTVFTIQGEDDGLGAEDRTITGFLLRETGAETTLVDSAGNEMTLPTEKVIGKTPMTLSVMPENLLNSMADQDLRDLFAFIQADSPPPAE
ncbi:MAG: dehydrogenase [Candidatus Hydrogenedentes bacterium]|nr:dehydrogenase [Candidatus Hydrogenedentota bacterium]